MFDCYSLEVCFFLKGDGRGLDLEEKQVSEGVSERSRGKGSSSKDVLYDGRTEKCLYESIQQKSSTIFPFRNYDIINCRFLA